jgi:teichuronic acid biosynthesis glycosyltransferase TuaG
MLDSLVNTSKRICMHERDTNLVSVIMPAHNCEAVLKQSVSSVIDQTYTDWELLIIDDASKDRTLAVARDLALTDERIRVIHLEKNAGVANARNAGVEAANGRYVAFLDSDDLWLPQKLAVQIAFMQQCNAAFVFAQYRRFSNNGTLSKPLAVPAHVTYEQLLKGNVIGCLTVVIDRAAVPDVNMPPIRHEDYVTWLRILRSGVVAYGISQDLARYRVASQSLSADKKKAAGWTWNIYRNIEGLSFAKSSWCFLNYFLHALYVRCLYQ